MKDLIKQLRNTPSRSKRELLDKAADAIEQLEQKLNALNSVTVQEWIPVSERLPEENGPLGTSYSLVQVLLSDGSVTTGWCSRGHKMWYYLPYGGTHFIGQECENAPVVAWQPMSEPPKERIDETILQQDELLKRRDALKWVKINDEGITGK